MEFWVAWIIQADKSNWKHYNVSEYSVITAAHQFSSKFDQIYFEILSWNFCFWSIGSETIKLKRGYALTKELKTNRELAFVRLSNGITAREF